MTIRLSISKLDAVVSLVAVRVVVAGQRKLEHNMQKERSLKLRVAFKITFPRGKNPAV